MLCSRRTTPLLEECVILTWIVAPRGGGVNLVGVALNQNLSFTPATSV
jgi:hypothetical protein